MVIIYYKERIQIKVSEEEAWRIGPRNPNAELWSPCGVTDTMASSNHNVRQFTGGLLSKDAADFGGSVFYGA